MIENGQQISPESTSGFYQPTPLKPVMSLGEYQTLWERKAPTPSAVAAPASAAKKER